MKKIIFLSFLLSMKCLGAPSIGGGTISPASYSLVVGIPLVPAGAIYNADTNGFGGASYNVNVNSNQYYIGVLNDTTTGFITDKDSNASSQVQQDNNRTIINLNASSLISTPDNQLICYNGDGTLIGQPVREQIYIFTTNYSYFIGELNGRFTGMIQSNTIFPTYIARNDRVQQFNYTDGSDFLINANVPGNADNQHDDVLSIRNSNRKRWSTIKFYDYLGVQQGAIGYGNDLSGQGSVVGLPLATYYNLFMFVEAPGFMFTHSGKIAGGWVYNVAYDATASFLMFYHSNGMGNDSTQDNITNNMTNVFFRVDPTTANTTFNTNGKGGVIFGTAPTFKLTNTAPTSVTIGTTSADLWIPFTNNGTVFMLPAWKNH